MYQPHFRYHHHLVRTLCTIDKVNGGIEERKVSASDGLLRKITGESRFIADVLRLEGIDLSPAEAQSVMEGAFSPLDPAKRQAISNLRQGFASLDIWHRRNAPLKQETIQELHRICLANLPKAGWHCGKYRNIQSWVVDRAKAEIVFTPPSPEMMPEMMAELETWLNSGESDELPSVIRAGIAHHWLMFIYPFVEGNERVACLLTLFILQQGKIGGWGALAITGRFTDDISSYYENLYSGWKGNRFAEDALEKWLDYFCQQVETGLRRTLDELGTPAEITVTESQPLSLPGELNERQRLILELSQRYSVFHRRDIQAEIELARRYNPKTLSRDLQKLVDIGLLTKGGERKGVFYSLKK